MKIVFARHKYQHPCYIGRWRATTVGALLFCLMCPALIIPRLADATAVSESLWKPEAAAYRVSLFLGNLVPIPWQKVEDAWFTAIFTASSEVPDYQQLEAFRSDGPLVFDINKSIRNKDRQALFESATRAVAIATIEALDKASGKLETGKSAADLALARELYRAFEDGIKQADPAGYRELGQAWLELTSAAGSRGVLGAGKRAPDPAKFASANIVIRSYLDKNYNPDAFLRRNVLAPLPELSVRENGEIQMPAALPPGSLVADQSPLPRLVLNFEEQGIDETQLPIVAYGDMLFDSANIFGEPARSLGLACSSCHNRSDVNRDFFIPGISHQPGSVDVDSAFFNPAANDHRDDPLDIPSLRGLRFTGPYGRDGRFASLRDFTRNVIVGEFAGGEPTPFMLDSLVAYMLEFDFLPNNRLLNDGRLSADSTASEVRGEVLFRQPFSQLDNQSCASCHVPSANFLDRKAHDIGSVRLAYTDSRSGAQDTPTLLGTRFTAPYFHDGSLPTLASVVNWFDEQFDLKLSQEDQSDLTAYIEAVGDASTPYEIFDANNTSFRLMFQELTTFATTLNLLIPRKDAQHALLLINTVATDLIADASLMSNLAAKRDIYQLAETLRGVGNSVTQNDWDAAWIGFQAFKEQVDVVDSEAY